MSKNINQIYTSNPITSNASTDLMYFGQSPYGSGNDAAMTFSSFSAQFPPLNGVVLLSPSGNQTINNAFNLTMASGSMVAPTMLPGNFSLSSNTMSTTNTNGIMALIPNGTGGVSVGSTTIAYTPSSSVLVTSLNQNNKFASLNLYSYEGSGSFGGTINLYGSKSTTIGSYSIVANTNVLGTIAFNADTGSNFATRASITCNVDGAPVGSVVPTNLKFNTASSAGGNTTALTISSSQIATFASSIAVTSDSTISGVDIGRGNNSSVTNSRFGVAANGAMTSGTYNTSLGYSACNLITQGAANTCVGSFSGSNNIAGSAQITTASNNTLIGYSASTNSSTSGGVIALGINALAEASTGSTSGTNGPGIAIGSATNKVGFRGDGSIFPGNLWRVKVNGTYYMIPLAADGSTSLPVANGGTGITSFGTGVATALGVNTNSTGGFAVETDGTFTPVLAFGGASVGITYSTQTASYKRVGNVVYFQVQIILTSKGSSTGAASITGLPITSSASNNSQCKMTPVNITYTSSPMWGSTGGSSTVISLQFANSGSGASLFNDTAFSNTSQIYLNGFYFV